MAKILPRSNGSYLVNSYNETRKALFWAKFWGWICVPCCCIGCMCLAPATILSGMIDDLSAIIKIYTSDKLKTISRDIDYEQDIFIQACNNVNAIALSVFPNIQLIDCMCVVDKKLGSMLEYKANFDLFISSNKSEKDAYMIKVFTEYVKLEGNTKVIIYGYPEYMARIYDPTSDLMTNIFRKLSSKTQLASFVFSHENYKVFN